MQTAVVSSRLKMPTLLPLGSGMLYLFVGADNKLEPLLASLGGSDLSVRDVGGDEAEQPFWKDLWTIVHVVLL